MTIRTLLLPWGLAGGLLALAGGAQAETRIGAYGGPTLYTDTQDFRSTGYRTGLSAGLVFDVDVSDRLRIRLAPGLVEKGSTGFRVFGDVGLDGVHELGYVELPVTLNVSQASGSVRLYFAGGGTVAYLVRARFAFEGSDEASDVKAGFRDWDLGLTLGGGLEFGKRTRGFVEGRYTWGLADVSVNQYTTLKNRGWQFLAGITFGL